MKYFEQTHEESILYRQVVKGDTIEDATWSISPTGPEAVENERTDTESTAMVSGLTAGLRYTLNAKLTLASGQVLEKSAVIRCLP